MTSSSVTLSRPPGIIICGMPRSSTTWIFNVVSAWLANAAQWERLWIEEGDSVAERSFCLRTTPIIGKCHHFSEEIARNSDIVIYSLRDIRTAAVSCLRKFGDCSTATAGAWIAHGEAWRKQSDVLIRYEDVAHDALRQIDHLRLILVKHLGDSAVRNLPPEVILAEVDQRFAAQQEATGTAYDPATMILPGHRTFQPAPDQLTSAERDLFDAVGAAYGVWLHANGYQDHHLGQDLDYRLAALALACCGESPVVVDVGAERGSFIDLALGQKAGTVHAFEPLPRHAEELARRFAGNQQVIIHTAAVSDRVGTADLHIATDRTGRELDYYHTLSDAVGDSTDVIRTAKSIAVEITSLSDAAEKGDLPLHIDMLKIDTDGHDLQVLHGLGKLRPQVIMAEFWEDLPDTSGKNPYTLADMVAWARTHGYDRHVVIRRNGILQSVAVDERWSAAGDWGNVIFFREDPWRQFLDEHLDAVSKDAFSSIQALANRLSLDCEQKESVIQAIHSQDVAVQKELQLLQHAADERAALIERLDAAVKAANEDRLAQAHRIATLEKSYIDAVQTHQQVEAANNSDLLVNLQAELDARNNLIQRLDANLRTAIDDRVAQAQQSTEREFSIREAQRLAAEAVEEAAALAAQVDSFAHERAESEARAQLITRLDAQLREANQDRLAQVQRIANLEAAAAEAVQARNRAEAAADPAVLATLQAELDTREKLIQRLDADLRAGIDDRLAQGARIATLEATTAEAIQARNRAEAAGDSRLYSQTQAELDARALLIERLDNQLKASNDDRIAKTSRIAALEAELLSIHRQMGDLIETSAETASACTTARIELESAHSELNTRGHLIGRLDAQLQDANADRIAQAKLISQLETLANEARVISASVMRGHDDSLQRVATLTGALDERLLVLERLDAQLQDANADRIAQTRVISQLQTIASEARAQTDSMARSHEDSLHRVAALSGALDERLAVLQRLDAQLQEANADRIAQAQLISRLESLANEARAERDGARAEAALRADEVHRTRALLARAEEAAHLANDQVAGISAELHSILNQFTTAREEIVARGEVITTLDRALQEANADRIARGEVIGGLQARIGELERHLAQLDGAIAEVSGQASAQADRATSLEAVAHERGVLIGRLDQLARDASERAAAAEAVREHLAREVAQQHAAAMAAAHQAADLAGSAEAATIRAEAAERERDARLVVIEELVKARDALSAALATRPTSWLGRLLYR